MVRYASSGATRSGSSDQAILGSPETADDIRARGKTTLSRRGSY